MNKKNVSIQIFCGSILPIFLFYIMVIIDHFIVLDKYIGPTPEAAQVVEYFMYGLIGLLFSNFLYPFINRIATKKRNFAKLIFQSLSYPVDYFWNSIILLGLTAKNLNPIVQTPLFTLIVISLSSLFQIPIRKSIELKYKDIRQEVFQDSAIRDISLFIIVLITLMLFVIR